jgi:hypothetical protein
MVRTPSKLLTLEEFLTLPDLDKILSTFASGSDPRLL